MDRHGDFAGDVDTRKSMTGYLMSLNGGPISWKSSRQGGVTLSISEAEFVDESQAGQEVVYSRDLLRGFEHCQSLLKAGETQKFGKIMLSCIMMSENPTNRDRSRHVDVKVHFLRDLVRDGQIKLVKRDGTQNVDDALPKSLPQPAFEKHKECMVGTTTYTGGGNSNKGESGPMPSYLILRHTSYMLVVSLYVDPVQGSNFALDAGIPVR